MRENLKCDMRGEDYKNAYGFPFSCPNYSVQKQIFFNSFWNLQLSTVFSLDLLMYGGDNFKLYMPYSIDVFNERNVRFLYQAT